MKDCSTSFLHRLVVVLAVIVFIAVSTAALAHGHSDTKSINESHCATCIAVHSAALAILTAAVALTLAAVLASYAFAAPGHTLVSGSLRPVQGRAPPQF